MAGRGRVGGQDGVARGGRRGHVAGTSGCCRVLSVAAGGGRGQWPVLSAVVPQLAYLLGEEAREGGLYEFRALWQRASQRAVGMARHLVLVVDGLDEDLRPGGSLSVAAVLPPADGRFVHVLISSRPHPELPSDVPVGHPLRLVRPVELQPFAGAQQLAELARQEIDDILRRDDNALALEVWRLLTAAAGPLSVEDLLVLIEAKEGRIKTARKIRRLLTEDAARSLQPIGSAEARRYTFAHLSLLEYAQAHDDLRDPDYRRRIRDWADTWRDRGWPTPNKSPAYLLDTYPMTLEDDPGRLAALCGDAAWVEAAIHAVGVDRASTHLREARAAAPGAVPVRALLDVVTGQTHNLRFPAPLSEPGFVARQLCLQALELEETVLAQELRTRLAAMPGAALWPVLTTRRSSRALVAELGRHMGGVSALAVLPDGRVVSGGYSHRVLVWAPAIPGADPVELGRHESEVSAIAVLPDGRVITGSDGVVVDWQVLMWDPAVPGVGPVEVGRRDSQVSAVEADRRDNRVSAMAVLPDGRLITGGNPDGRLIAWDPAIPEPPRKRSAASRAGPAMAVLPDGRLISGGADGRLMAWDPACPGPTRWRSAATTAVFGDGGAAGRAADQRRNRDGRVMAWDPAYPEPPRWRSAATRAVCRRWRCCRTGG